MTGRGPQWTRGRNVAARCGRWAGLGRRCGARPRPWPPHGPIGDALRHLVRPVTQHRPGHGQRHRRQEVPDLLQGPLRPVPPVAQPRARLLPCPAHFPQPRGRLAHFIAQCPRAAAASNSSRRLIRRYRRARAATFTRASCRSRTSIVIPARAAWFRASSKMAPGTGRIAPRSAPHPRASRHRRAAPGRTIRSRASPGAGHRPRRSFAPAACPARAGEGAVTGRPEGGVEDMRLHHRDTLDRHPAHGHPPSIPARDVTP